MHALGEATIRSTDFRKTRRAGYVIISFLQPKIEEIFDFSNFIATL